ncbi:hypothetical protein MRX96_032930 [Rhipicephalus microplus]
MATAQQNDSELQMLRLQENFLKLEDVQLPGCAIHLTGSRGGPEALLLTDIMAESVARGLITVWISHYGVP